MDISQRTFKYLHGAHDSAHLSFATGGVPRSFTAIRYVAMEDPEIDPEANGVVIIDNDNLSIVIDGHFKDKPVDQAKFLGDVRAMSWADFCALVIDHPRFRNRDDDIGNMQPSPGVLTNQIQRGVLDAPEDRGDLRSPAMVKAHADPSCPYRFPAASRLQMISDIMTHGSLRDDDSQWRLAWEATFDDACAVTGTAADKGRDEAWALHYEANPEVFHQITSEITEDFFCSRVTTWPPVDNGRYGFIPAGMTTICLDTIDNVSMAFSNRGDLGRFLDGLPDVLICDLWKLVRVVDHDLHPDILSATFENKIAAHKMEFDLSRFADLEPAEGP